MQRRDFLKYSLVTSSTILVPQLAQSNEFTKMVKAAWYCSKLNPVRFIAGLIFDEVAEIYLKPLAKKYVTRLIQGFVVSSSSLSYVSASEIKSPTIEHEPYKASVVVYGNADYTLTKNNMFNLDLKRDIDKERFNKIHDYMKSNSFKLKLYDRDTTFVVGNTLEPTDLFNMEYFVVKDKEKHIEELLKYTDNKVYQRLIA